MNRNRNAITSVLRPAATATMLTALVLMTGCATESGMMSAKTTLGFDRELSAENDSSQPTTQLVGYQQPAADTAGISILQSDEILEDRFRQAEGNVIVDFYADWCGPCKALGARLKNLEPTAKQHGVSVIKVNIDHHPQLARQYKVSGVPTLLRVRDGSVIERQSGVMAEDELKLWMLR